MYIADDPEFWFGAGVDIAGRRWTNWQLCTDEELRELGREQIQNPIPGNNAVLRQLEQKYPTLEKRRPRQ